MSDHSVTDDLGDEQLWLEIDQLVDDIAEFARPDVSPSEFYSMLLTRTVSVLAADAGAVWRLDSDGQLARELRVPEEGSAVVTDRHANLARVALQGKPVLLAPREKQRELWNPTDSFVILMPVWCGGSGVAVVEIVQPANTSRSTVQGCQEVLRAVCSAAEQFHTSREICELRRREQRHLRRAGFLQRIHQSLDLNATAYTIANDGRDLLGCGRLSVLAVSGARSRTLAISGVDSVQRRARLVQLLEELTSAAASQDGSLFYHGQCDELPPQLAACLQAYVDASHSRHMGIVGLRTPDADSTCPSSWAAIVAEDFETRVPDAEFDQEVREMAAAAAGALSNSIRYTRTPLLPLLKRCGDWTRRLRQRHLAKTVLVMSAIVVCVLAMILVRMEFAISARGSLQPQQQRRVFATENSVVEQMYVSHSQRVRAGDPLLRLRNDDLELEQTRISGELQTAEELLRAIQGQRFASRADRSNLQAPQLAAEERSLTERISALRQQLAMLAERSERLTLRSPIDGHILTWQAADRLMNRPVQPGQELLVVADAVGGWMAELEIPDRDIRHVLRAREELGGLEVRCRLASHPQELYVGRVTQIATRSEVRKGNRPAVLVSVDLDMAENQTLRPGTEVTAKIVCGRRSIGYVWLRDLWETIQWYLLF